MCTFFAKSLQFHFIQLKICWTARITGQIIEHFDKVHSFIFRILGLICVKLLRISMKLFCLKSFIDSLDHSHQWNRTIGQSTRPSLDFKCIVTASHQTKKVIKGYSLRIGHCGTVVQKLKNSLRLYYLILVTDIR